MHYVILDYDFIKTNDFYWQGLDLLSPQDIVQVICSDSDTDYIYQKLTSAGCPAKIIISDSHKLTVTDCSITEIIIISTRENYLVWQNDFQTNKICRYASIEKYFSHAWKRKRDEVLSRLELDDEKKQQVGFWVRRAFCIKNSGRRNYKTHNRLQNIIRNSEQLKQVYQAVKPFL